MTPVTFAEARERLLDTLDAHPAKTRGTDPCRYFAQSTPLCVVGHALADVLGPFIRKQPTFNELPINDRDWSTDLLTPEARDVLVHAQQLQDADPYLTWGQIARDVRRLYPAPSPSPALIPTQ